MLEKFGELRKLPYLCKVNKELFNMREVATRGSWPHDCQINKTRQNYGN